MQLKQRNYLIQRCYVKFIPLLSVLCLFCHTKSFTQSPFYSESLIKYDLSTHTTDKPIPFDRSFTLVIDKLSRKNLDRVEVFEAKFKDGKRVLVENTFKDCEGNQRTTAVKDMELRTNPYSDTMQLFFPPLKPNCNFDVLVVYKLKGKTRDLLLDVNAHTSAGNSAKAAVVFTAFFKSTMDNLIDRSSCSIITYNDYLTFYNTSLKPVYLKIADDGNFKEDGILSENDIIGIDKVTSGTLADFKDGGLLIEVNKKNYWKQLLKGFLDIKNVFLPADEAVTTSHFANARLQNMSSNIVFFDSIIQRLNRVISKGIASVNVYGNVIAVTALQSKVEAIKQNLDKNYATLSEYMTAINSAIDDDPRLRQGTYLAGNTVSSDLKTAGGNILFLDAGFTNIVAAGLTDKPVYIPKLYWGVSIYFRPIDKNTRRSRFSTKFDPKKYYGCHTVVISTNPNGTPKETENQYGPDYGVATRRDILQHLSLNLGITVGAMSNKDFDNFYNGTSLLIGPAYRLARGFKISSGLALLKRTSKNPLITDKKIVPGGYLSVSVDIDFIQGLKDITSILFK